MATVVNSLLIVFSSLACFDNSGYANGKLFGFYNFGNMVLFGVILISNIKCHFMSSSISIYFLFITLLSTGFFFAIWNYKSGGRYGILNDTFGEILSSVSFYIYLFNIISICLAEYFFLKFYYYLTEYSYIP